MEKFSLKDIFENNKDSSKEIFFNDLEFPNKKMERYRNFSLDDVLKEGVYQNVNFAQNCLSLEKEETPNIINFKNKFYFDKNNLENISVSTCSIKDLKREIKEKIFSNLNFFGKVSFLNSKEILVIDVLDNLTNPIRINYYFDEKSFDNTLYTPIYILNVKENVSLTLVETYFDESGINNLVLPYSYINIAENSNLECYRYLETKSNKILLGNNVDINGNANFNLVNLNFANNKIIQDIDINLLNENSFSNVSNINIANDLGLIDNFINMNHKASFTSSLQDVKNILNNDSKTYFTGEIFVDKNIKKVKANQTCKSILLSKSSKAYTKPSLKIFSDDVECSHGATFGELDKSALFFLQSRGINEVLAKKMLLMSFVWEVLQKVKDEKFLEVCKKKIV